MGHKAGVHGAIRDGEEDGVGRQGTHTSGIRAHVGYVCQWEWEGVNVRGGAGEGGEEVDGAGVQRQQHVGNI